MKGLLTDAPPRNPMLRVALFVVACAGSPAVCAEEIVGDTVVLTCRRGEEPGQFHFLPFQLFQNEGAPYCFAIDEAGNFYIPDKDLRHSKARINKFDRNGNFSSMFELKEKTTYIWALAVTPGARFIYLAMFDRKAREGDLPPESTRIVSKYDADGNRIYQLGPEGVLQPNQPVKDGLRPMMRLIALPDGGVVYTTTWGGRWVEDTVGGKIIANRTIKTEILWKFDRDGHLVEKREGYPDELKRDYDTLRVMYDIFYRHRQAQGEQIVKVSMQQCVIGPDGQFYYMDFADWDEQHRVAHELRIYKVTFSE